MFLSSNNSTYSRPPAVEYSKCVDGTRYFREIELTKTSANWHWCFYSFQGPVANSIPIDPPRRTTYVLVMLNWLNKLNYISRWSFSQHWFFGKLKRKLRLTFGRIVELTKLTWPTALGATYLSEIDRDRERAGERQTHGLN